VTVFGYHASHEQFGPKDLLGLVQRAEAAGFARVSASDHIQPWSEAQGQSGFVWSWLGAAMERTTIPFRTVSAPGWRYHPAILAQAGATLAVMYPGRLAMAIGTGEAINESITGLPWPMKSERAARLEECAAIMRSLWAGDTVTHHGRVVVEDLKLYTRPAAPPLLVGAAVTPETAAWIGAWADALITVAVGPTERLRRIVEAFRSGGGEGKPVFAQAKVAWAPDEAQARGDGFEQWRTNLLEGDAAWELRSPRQFEQAAALLRPEDLDRGVNVSGDLGCHAAWLADYAAAGCDEITIHNVCRNQAEFIDAFGAKVLPQLR
jgi:coenzyme F420-dependent glucose-6-phosphate dehydrogenase